jgi:hypothetical protein
MCGARYRSPFRCRPDDKMRPFTLLAGLRTSMDGHSQMPAPLLLLAMTIVGRLSCFETEACRRPAAQLHGCVRVCSH